MSASIYLLQIWSSDLRTSYIIVPSSPPNTQSSHLPLQTFGDCRPRVHLRLISRSFWSCTTIDAKNMPSSHSEWGDGKSREGFHQSGKGWEHRPPGDGVGEIGVCSPNEAESGEVKKEPLEGKNMWGKGEKVRKSDVGKSGKKWDDTMQNGEKWEKVRKTYVTLMWQQGKMEKCCTTYLFKSYYFLKMVTEKSVI
ncbi:hypothetical protein R6Q59_026808 [Mikania micrantha]